MFIKYEKKKDPKGNLKTYIKLLKVTGTSMV